MRLAFRLALLLLFLPASARAACMTAEPAFSVESGGGSRLRQPSDLALREDRLYVLDDLNGRVAVYSLQGEYLSAVSLPGGKGRPYLGMDIGGDDNIYLASPTEGKVVVLDGRGKAVRDFGLGGKASKSEPVSVTISRGTCFVVDNEQHRVLSFDLEGNPLESWGELGEGAVAFRYPFRIVQDSTGRVIVTDTLNSRVKMFTPKGEPLGQFGEFGVIEGTLYRPAGIALWGEDLVLVSDNYLGSVQLFDTQGAYRSTVCGSDGKPLLFDSPVSLATGRGMIFVLEMGAARVRAFRLSP